MNDWKKSLFFVISCLVSIFISGCISESFVISSDKDKVYISDSVTLSIDDLPEIDTEYFVQWYRDDEVITGETGLSLVISDLNLHDNGKYHVRVQLGDNVIKSNDLDISVTPDLLSRVESLRGRVSASDTGDIQGVNDILEGIGDYTINFNNIANKYNNHGNGFTNIFNVLDYGACPISENSVCLGVDSSDAINLAYQDANSNGGGIVFIPPGEYELYQQIKPVGNVRTVAYKTMLNRQFHAPLSSNAPESGLILFKNISNFSWIGGEINNGDGEFRGRAVEVRMSSDFELQDLSIYHMGLNGSGEPSASVGLFVSDSSDFYIHDIQAESWYKGDEEFPSPTGNTNFRLSGSNTGVLYKMKGYTSDNILDLTADNSGKDLSQFNILSIDVEARQNSGYGVGSAVIVGTAGSQRNHPGSHFDLYFVDVSHDSGGDLTQPQFEVINSGDSGSSYVHDIHFVGISTTADALEAFRVWQSRGNLGINNIYIRDSVLKNELGPSIRTQGLVYDIYLSETEVSGAPDFQLSASTNIIQE